MNIIDFLKQQLSQTKKPAIIIGSLVFCLLLMTILLGYSSTQSNYMKEYINLSSKMNVDILKIIKHATDSEKSNANAFPKLFESKENFDRTLGILVNGDPDSNLPATPEDNQQNLSKINKHWIDYKKNIETILSAEKSIRITK